MVRRFYVDLRSLIQAVSDSPPALFFYGAWFNLSVRFIKWRPDGYDLLIPTNGGGNIGDQAMFEAYLRNRNKAVLAVLSRPDALDVPSDFRERVRTVVIPGLTSGRPQLSWRPTYELCKLIGRADRVAIVGADIVDGSYGVREAMVRLRVLEACQHLGVPARVLGFSWSDKPDRRVAARYQKLRDVQLFVRDGRSVARTRKLGLANVTPCSDMVFSLAAPALGAKDSDEMQDRSSVGVNVSGLLAARGLSPREYIPLVSWLVDSGYRVSLIPHVVRDGDDDLSAARELHSQLSERLREQVSVVEHELDPTMVQELVASMDFVITGRMHLGIIALSVGTPALIVGTQGKVEGMLELFGLSDLALSSSVSLLDQIVPRVDRGQLHHYRQVIAAKRASVAELSFLNFN